VDVDLALGLVTLALPILILLAAQALMMALFVIFVTFRVMGNSYDAAVLAAGHCVFGLSSEAATRNAADRIFGGANSGIFPSIAPTRS